MCSCFLVLISYFRFLLYASPVTSCVFVLKPSSFAATMFSCIKAFSCILVSSYFHVSSHHRLVTTFVIPATVWTIIPSASFSLSHKIIETKNVACHVREKPQSPLYWRHSCVKTWRNSFSSDCYKEKSISPRRKLHHIKNNMFLIYLILHTGFCVSYDKMTTYCILATSA